MHTFSLPINIYLFLFDQIYDIPKVCYSCTPSLRLSFVRAVVGLLLRVVGNVLSLVVRHVLSISIGCVGGVAADVSGDDVRDRRRRRRRRRNWKDGGRRGVSGNDETGLR